MSKEDKKSYWKHVVCGGCPTHCRYRDFKVFSGQGFQDTIRDLWVESDNPESWKYKRRGTVLGRMHAHKKQMWEQYTHNCPHNKEM